MFNSFYLFVIFKMWVFKKLIFIRTFHMYFYQYSCKLSEFWSSKNVLFMTLVVAWVGHHKNHKLMEMSFSGVQLMFFIDEFSNLGFQKINFHKNVSHVLLSIPM